MFLIILLQSLKLLSVMSAIRLDEKPDKIENVLLSSLMDGTVSAQSSQKSIEASHDPLASSTWEEVCIMSRMCKYVYTCL